MLSHYKKHGDMVLKRYVAEALAKTIETMLRQSRGRGGEKYGDLTRIVLVPVPTSLKSFVIRGFSPVSDVLKSAYFEQRRRSLYEKFEVTVAVQRVLKLKVKNSIFHVAQKGSSAQQRISNQAGVMKLGFWGQQRLCRRWHAGVRSRTSTPKAVSGRLCYVLVDDVLTTGATLLEAHRALTHGLASALKKKTKASIARSSAQNFLRCYGIECNSAIVVAATGYQEYF